MQKEKTTQILFFANSQWRQSYLVSSMPNQINRVNMKMSRDHLGLKSYSPTTVLHLMEFLKMCITGSPSTTAYMWHQSCLHLHKLKIKFSPGLRVLINSTKDFWPIVSSYNRVMEELLPRNYQGKWKVAELTKIAKNYRVFNELIISRNYFLFAGGAALAQC